MAGRRRTVQMHKFGELLLTRDRARSVATKLPAADILILSFKGVKVASPSFLDQIIRSMYSRGVTEIQFDHFNRQTGRNIDRVLDAMDLVEAKEIEEALVG